MCVCACLRMCVCECFSVIANRLLSAWKNYFLFVCFSGDILSSLIEEVFLVVCM